MASRLEQLLVMLNEDPKDPFLRYAVAVEHASAGNVSEAITRIEQLLTDHPEYLGAYYKLGQLYEQTGDYEKALDVYRRGATLAQKQGNRKTLSELNEAIQLLED